jgi:hypothetical protein
MTSQDALTIAVTLTDEILTVLEDQNLERLAELEAKREPFIHRAFDQSIQQIDHIKAVHLQNLNQQVVEKLQYLKHSIQQKKQHVSHASKATQAYRGNQV